MVQKIALLLGILGAAFAACTAQESLSAIPNTAFVVSVKKLMADSPRKLVCFTLYPDSSFELQTAEVHDSKPRHRVFAGKLNEGDAAQLKTILNSPDLTSANDDVEQLRGMVGELVIVHISRVDHVQSMGYMLHLENESRTMLKQSYTNPHRRKQLRPLIDFLNKAVEKRKDLSPAVAREPQCGGTMLGEQQLRPSPSKRP